MPRVLIIDDEPAIRRAMCGILSNEGYTTTDAASALEALPMLNENVFDAIFCDIKMPQMDGIEFTEKLLERFPDTKVIFLTAYSEFEYARQAVRLGVSDYLLKPFQDGELEGAIQRLLHLHPVSMV